MEPRESITADRLITDQHSINNENILYLNVTELILVWESNGSYSVTQMVGLIKVSNCYVRTKEKLSIFIDYLIK